jgi:hypothetical protein
VDVEFLEIDEGDARRLIRNALGRYPEDGWTADRLAKTLGLPITTVGRALLDLTERGTLIRIDDEYVPAFFQSDQLD